MSPISTSRTGHVRSASRTHRSGPMPAGSPMVTAMDAGAVMAAESDNPLDVNACRIAEEFDFDLRRGGDGPDAIAERDARLRETAQRLRRLPENIQRVQRP